MRVYATVTGLLGIVGAVLVIVLTVQASEPAVSTRSLLTLLHKAGLNRAG